MPVAWSKIIPGKIDKHGWTPKVLCAVYVLVHRDSQSGKLQLVALYPTDAHICRSLAIHSLLRDRLSNHPIPQQAGGHKSENTLILSPVGDRLGECSVVGIFEVGTDRQAARDAGHSYT